MAPPRICRGTHARAGMSPPPGHTLGRIAATKQLVQIADIKTIPSYIEGHPFVRRSCRTSLAYRTVLAVPMLKDDELIGAIVIYRQEVRPFTDKQIELVTELRRPGRHRHREHAAAQRAARILAAADRHRRRAQGHQPLDLRSADCARHARSSRPRAFAKPKWRSYSVAKVRRYLSAAEIYGFPPSLSRSFCKSIPIEPGRGTVTGPSRARRQAGPYPRCAGRPGIRPGRRLRN